MEQKTINAFLNIFSGTIPHAHIVLGSGFGSALDSLEKSQKDFLWEKEAEVTFHEVPGLPQTTVVDHAGKYRLYKNKKSKRTILIQMGRLHGYEGLHATEVVKTVMAPRLAGIKNFILSNAAGAVNAKYCAGDVMLLRDHVNFTGENPLRGKNPKNPEGKEIGTRFPDLTRIYQSEWKSALKKNLLEQKLTVHEGTYIGVLGPSFETKAEVELFQRWGMDAVGMSTVWEAIALAHSGATISGLSLISNMGAGLGDAKPLEHEKIVELCRGSAGAILQGILNTFNE